MGTKTDLLKNKFSQFWFTASLIGFGGGIGGIAASGLVTIHPEITLVLSFFNVVWGSVVFVDELKNLIKSVNAETNHESQSRSDRSE
jgi:ABC-type Mn2+/Zn2+ transport system permease subunit